MAQTAELDWEQVAAARTRAAAKGETYALPPGSAGADADLVLGVDCIYNEHLVRPLVDTLAAACARGAVAWVVAEKRSPEVVSLTMCGAAMWSLPAYAVLAQMRGEKKWRTSRKLANQSSLAQDASADRQLSHFLDTWQSDRAGFTIVRLGDDAMGDWEGERGRWVGWVGWL